MIGSLRGAGRDLQEVDWSPDWGLDNSKETFEALFTDGACGANCSEEEKAEGHKAVVRKMAFDCSFKPKQTKSARIQV